MSLEISNFDPAPSQGIGSGSPLRFDVTGSGAYAITVEIDGVRQLVWTGTSFTIPFAGQSSRSEISGGYRYTLRRNDNRWPAYPSVLLQPLSTTGGTTGGTLDPDPDTVPQRGPLGELYATAFQGNADGTRDTVLARFEDTRIVLDGSGAIVLQQWVTSAWITRGILDLSEGFRLRSNGADVTGIVIDTSGEQATEPQAADTVSLWAYGGFFGVTDQSGASVSINRTRPVLTSFGTATLGYDLHHVFSGTATPSALPAATADDVGLELWVSNKRTTPIDITRAGSDTIDGSATVRLLPGQSARFEVVSSGLWRAHVVERGGGSSGLFYGDITRAVEVYGSTVELLGTTEARLSAGSVRAACSDSSGTFLCATNAPMRIQPQQATSGAGRSVAINVGEGQTPGTSAPGNLEVGLGTIAGGVSGALQIRETSNARRLDISLTSVAAQVVTSNNTSLALLSGSNEISILSGTYVLLRSPGLGGAGMYVDATDINFRTGAGSTTGAKRGGSATIASATVTNVVTFLTGSNRVYQVLGYITVSNDTDNEGAVYMVRGAFKNVAGTVTQIGATQTVAADLEDAGQTGLSAVLDFTGTTIRLRLATDAADTVNADGVLELHERVLV